MKCLVLSFFILCAGCFCSSDDDASTLCTEQFVYGLYVTVKNASNNVVITEGIAVIVIDDDYNEELLNHFNPESFVGAGERTGNYIIKVIGDGFVSFTTGVIAVAMTDDDCHVIPEIVEIIIEEI